MGLLGIAMIIVHGASVVRNAMAQVKLKSLFTRGDRIRSMSDKEFAEFISSFPINTLCDIVCNGNCKAVATLEKDSDEVCEEIVQKWLEEEWY